ncbi:MAG: acyl-CoA thioesterase, partial [Clostridia bacterium]|nr:acyl-CoA thioesterase [Clostridia bacterium]
SFAALHQQGIDAVVARLNMAFKHPLKSGEEFLCTLRLKKDGIKYVFHQDIYRLPDMKLSCRAIVDTVCVVDGKMTTVPQLDRLAEE